MRKVVAFDGRGAILVLEQPIPEPGPGEILLEVRASMISPGTEMAGVVWRRENPSDAETIPFGYQNAGDVLAVGEGVTRWRVGDKLACMGIDDALHATHSIIPVNLCVPIPEGVSYEEAASAHIGATALHAVRRAELQISEFMVVVGLGIVGQFVAQLARLSGAYVMGLDRLASRLEVARQLGADRVVNGTEEDVLAAGREFSRGYGLDCGILAFGGEGTEVFQQVVAMLKVSPDTHQMGRVVIVGGTEITHRFAASLGNVDVRSAARTGPGFLDPDYEHGRDYPPVFVPWTTQRNLEEILLLTAAGRLEILPFITHRFPIDEAPAACDILIEHPEQA
ncbi:MAG TPA: zinc-binding alcohol dehydrogenase, partial [Armatimonadota bacterium]|nr:zinc-binding alcohol dehydrogenase [Armatimonadota bacterium]